MQAVEITQEFGEGFYKYLVVLLHFVHFVLSFPTVQDAFDTTPIINLVIKYNTIRMAF